MYALLVVQLLTLNVKDLCHELSFSLCQVKALFRKFEAVCLVKVAQLTQGEIDLLERVN